MYIFLSQEQKFGNLGLAISLPSSTYHQQHALKLSHLRPFLLRPLCLSAHFHHCQHAVIKALKASSGRPFTCSFAWHLSQEIFRTEWSQNQSKSSLQKILVDLRLGARMVASLTYWTDKTTKQTWKTTRTVLDGSLSGQHELTHIGVLTILVNIFLTTAVCVTLFLLLGEDLSLNFL